jgi:predicted permease
MKLWRRREQDLEDEIRDYVERETQENIASGMPPDEARHAAMRKFGHVLSVKEDTRAVWGWVWLERLWQDLRYGRRMLLKHPGFTLVAVVSLAIGIGANSAMFSLADALLLRPLPVLRPGDVVTVGSISAVERFSALIASYRDYVDFRDRSRSFDGLVAFTISTFGFSTRPDALPQLKAGMLVTGNFFSVMGVEPELGRDFRTEEDAVPGRDAVVIVGHELWEKEFGSDRSILGRRVRLNGIECTIIGVAPAKFTGMDQYLTPAFFLPMGMWLRFVTNPQDRPLEARDYRQLTIKGRLRPGVTIAQAQAELAVIAKNLERAYPDTNRNRTAVVRTELESRIAQSPPDAELVAMLSVLAGVVLLVACANVAGLLTSRAPVRAREIALRLAIGAGRARLIRQLLTESLLIAVAGGLLGLAVAYGGVVYLSQIRIPSDLPIKFTIELDRRALIFSLAVSLASAILFGLAPAIQTTHADLVSSLKAAGAGTTGRRRLWGRNFLVAGQVALSLVLLTVSTFMFRGFRSMLQAGPSCRTDHVLMMSFDPGLVHYTEAQAEQFFRQLAERSRSVPGVKSASLAFGIPMGNQQDGATIVPEGFQFPQGKESASMFANTVDESYFETMGVPIVRGRGFRVTDTAKSPRVAVVNEQVANHYWPGQDPVGKRFRLDDQKGPWVEIVGVAKTGKYIFIAEAPMDFLYFPLAQHPQQRMKLLVHSVGDPNALVAPLREVVRGLDANQPIFDVRTFDDFYRYRAVSTPKMIIQTVGTMGLMGLILAMVGLYGLVAYAASRRTREIGIRMAIGAQRTNVLRMVMRQGLLLSLTGLGIGLIASFGAERVLKCHVLGPRYGHPHLPAGCARAARHHHARGVYTGASSFASGSDESAAI